MTRISVISAAPTAAREGQPARQNHRFSESPHPRRQPETESVRGYPSTLPSSRNVMLLFRPPQSEAPRTQRGSQYGPHEAAGVLMVAHRYQGRGHILGLLLAVIRRLTTDWWRVEELAEDLAISRRTAFRILETLTREGLPLEHVLEDRAVYHRLAQRWWESDDGKPQRARSPARAKSTPPPAARSRKGAKPPPTRTARRRRIPGKRSPAASNVQ